MCGVKEEEGRGGVSWVSQYTERMERRDSGVTTKVAKALEHPPLLPLATWKMSLCTLRHFSGSYTKAKVKGHVY